MKIAEKEVIQNIKLENPIKMRKFACNECQADGYNPRLPNQCILIKYWGGEPDSGHPLHCPSSPVKDSKWKEVIDEE